MISEQQSKTPDQFGERHTKELRVLRDPDYFCHRVDMLFCTAALRAELVIYSPSNEWMINLRLTVADMFALREAVDAALAAELEKGNEWMKAKDDSDV